MEKKSAIPTASRRSWDVDAYQRKADERKRREQEPDDAVPLSADPDAKPEFQPAAPGAAGPEGSQRAFLTARQGKISDLDERIGSKVEVTIDDAVGGGSGPDAVVKKVGVGWQCSVCNCMLKDSNAYLDHINGRRHLKKLGFSMRVERSTEADLKNKLEELQKKKQREQEEEPKIEIVDFGKIVKEKDEAERIRVEVRRKQRKERRREKDQQASKDEGDDGEEDDEPAAEINPDLAAMMGFSNFGA